MRSSLERSDDSLFLLLISVVSASWPMWTWGKDARIAANETQHSRFAVSQRVTSKVECV